MSQRTFPTLSPHLRRTVLYTLVWWALTGGEPGSWIIGIPAIAAAIYARSLLPGGSDWSISIRGFMRFVPAFLWGSMRGSWDVALRALRPRLDVAPGMITISLRLPSETARTFLANVISLMPGTLTAELSGSHITLQTLDTRAPVVEEVARLERLVADMFGLHLDGAS